MKKDARIFLQHILESIDWIDRDTKDLAEENFTKMVEKLV